VRAVTVVMTGVLSEGRPQVPLVVDEHPVGALGPDRCWEQPGQRGQDARSAQSGLAR
jgi:hypothetical protein